MKNVAPATFLWRIEIRVPGAAVGDFEAALEPRCASVSSFMLDSDDNAGDSEGGGDWRIEGFTGAEPDKEALARDFAKAARTYGIGTPKAKIELVPPTDWLAENLIDFPPLRIGRYFIHGSQGESPPPGSVAIMLDAGAAFGSGEHPSTAGCLMALDRLARGRRFGRPLDMGCGSGILTLAMAGTWKVPVVACDIDPEAVRVTAGNARNNAVANLVRAVHGPSYQTPAVRDGGPYDLIAANILTRPLCDMANDAARLLDRPGVILLAGLVERDAMRVIQRHRAHGLSLMRTLTLEGWITIVMGR